MRKGTVSNLSSLRGFFQGNAGGGQQPEDAGFVLKRLRLDGRKAAADRRRSHFREAYFGGLLGQLPNCNPGSRCDVGRQHIVRFVEAFEVSLLQWGPPPTSILCQTRRWLPLYACQSTTITAVYLVDLLQAAAERRCLDFVR